MKWTRMWTQTLYDALKFSTWSLLLRFSNVLNLGVVKLESFLIRAEVKWWSSYIYFAFLDRRDRLKSKTFLFIYRFLIKFNTLLTVKAIADKSTYPYMYFYVNVISVSLQINWRKDISGFICHELVFFFISLWIRHKKITRYVCMKFSFSRSSNEKNGTTLLISLCLYDT